ncbi:MAG: MBL fold metallo-hydrolase [Desulfovibrio sp.]
MRVRFWGVRGSLPAPGPDTVRYGGNTSCIEVLSDSGDRIILDGGTGIRPLGLELAARSPMDCVVFVTHTHWDHIQGLPFFVPLFIPGNRVTIHGPPDPVNMRGMECVLEIQMAYPYFPVRKTELQADIVFETLAEGQCVERGALRVTSILMNHSSFNLGYRVDDVEQGTSLFFTGDHEPFANIYSPEEDGFAEYQEAVDGRNARLDALVAGVDLVVADAQYTESEYPTRRGWGHTAMPQAVEFALRAGATQILLTHHETARSDSELDALLVELRQRYAGSGIDIDFAREGGIVEPASRGS